MRFVDRRTVTAPEGLSEKAEAEYAEAETYFRLSKDLRNSDDKPEFRAYKLASVKAQLEKLFGGKCAYCESFYAQSAPVDIEHYRPKGRVHGASNHDGYWWLAADWENLLPSCIDCNRRRRQRTPKPKVDLSQLFEDSKGLTLETSTGKKDSFPLLDEAQRATTRRDSLANERPLVLNPCDDDPEKYLDFRYDPEIGASIVFPRTTGSARSSNPVGRSVDEAAIRADAEAKRQDLLGAMSIHVYGLNRLGLVQERTKIIRQLEFQATLVRDLDELMGVISQSNLSGEQLEKVADKVNAMQDRILRQMCNMTEASAPYSAVAKAWVEQFLEEIEGERQA